MTPAGRVHHPAFVAQSWSEANAALRGSGRRRANANGVRRAQASGLPKKSSVAAAIGNLIATGPMFGQTNGNADLVHPVCCTRRSLVASEYDATASVRKDLQATARPTGGGDRRASGAVAGSAQVGCAACAGCLSISAGGADGGTTYCFWLRERCVPCRKLLDSLPPNAEVAAIRRERGAVQIQ